MSAPLTATPAHPVTRDLAAALLEVMRDGAPPSLRHHAATHLVNVVALAAAAARQPGVQAVVDVAGVVGGQASVPLPGRLDVLDDHHASLAAGLAAHHDDFDDTHLATVIHPSAATFAALLPVTVAEDVPGPALLDAFALGCEAQLRVGMAMSPSHYDAGWHITGTCGVIGAAVAVGLVTGLKPEKLTQAIGLAASMTVGQREGFGTSLKPMHAGKAAANGLLAARLAGRGFTASERALESPRGMFAVLADESRPEQVLEGWGSSWEFLADTVKPYPCGVVIHPLIDAALEQHASGVDATQVRAVRIRCHPLVLDLTGVRAPATGLAAKFSANHAVAAALEDGSVSLATFSDERVRYPSTVRLRDTVGFVPDPAIRRDQAVMQVTLADGRIVTTQVEHGRGSPVRPLTAEECHAKVQALLAPVRRSGARELLACGDALLEGGGMRALVEATAPEEA